MDWYTVAWFGWIVAFLVIEGLAIRDDDPGDTLSEHVWRWFSVTERTTGWRVRRIALGGFMMWLTVHFLTGGWM